MLEKQRQHKNYVINYAAWAFLPIVTLNSILRIQSTIYCTAYFTQDDYVALLAKYPGFSDDIKRNTINVDEVSLVRYCLPRLLAVG